MTSTSVWQAVCEDPQYNETQSHLHALITPILNYIFSHSFCNYCFQMC